MDIVNVKTIAYKAIKSVTGIKLVTTSYPDTFAVYPTAVYSAAHSSYFRDGDKNELLTQWTITIDLFLDQGSLTDITNQLYRYLVIWAFLMMLVIKICQEYHEYSLNLVEL